MERAHYALQALLYTVALHRYLRWRLPGYDPERNLAGVLLPVPARDDRARTRRSSTARRAACSPGGRPRALVRGAERRCSTRGRGVTRRPTRSTPARALARARRCCATFNDAGVLARRRRARRARGSPRWPARRDEAVAARRRARRARAAARPRLRRPRDDPRHRDRRRRRAGRPLRAAVAGAGGVGGARRGEPARGRRATARAAAARRHARSTSTATGARSASVAADLRALGGRPPADVDDAVARRRPRPPVRRRADGAPARSPPRPRCGAASPSSPAGPGTGKTTTVARIVALLAEQARGRRARAARRARRADRQGGRAARGGGARRGARRSPSTPRVRDAAARARRLDAAPAARLAARTATAASATTAATGCRTTS